MKSPTQLMACLKTSIQEAIPTESDKKWYYEFPLGNSCYKIENAIVLKAIIKGKGGTQYETMDMEISLQLYVGYGYHLQVLSIVKRGITETIQELLELPKKAIICKECAKLRIGKETHCPNCLFIELYACVNHLEETCSICQESTFRTQLPCGHFFHMSCLLEMSPEDAKCPNCRTPFNEQLVKQIYGEHYSDDSDSDEESDDDDDYSV